MAQGRMLKKNISTSRRLSELKSDSARLLYTWLLAHLDVEGRFSANEYIIKGYIVPRIDSLTPERIKELIEDLAKNELIILYKVDGDRYLQFRKFSEHQNLRKDRESKSDIPEPPQELLPSSSSITPAQDKISKDKLSKENNQKKSNQNINIPFSDFWNEYDKKVGDKRKLKKKWHSLKGKEREAIMKYLPKYKEVTPNKKYRKHPQTFLNNQSWEDDLDDLSGDKQTNDGWR